MKDSYVKAILYAYPHLKDVAEATAVCARNKAALSYKSPLDSLSLMEKIAGEMILSEELYALSDLVDEVLSHLGKEERFLIGYKYFRRAKREGAPACSERAYYRRQRALTEKLLPMFGVRLSESDFIARFGGCSFLMRLYRATQKGEERTISVRRRVPLYQKSCSASGCTGFFPRMTKTAAPTAATQAAQIAAMAAPESPLCVSPPPAAD